jgi:hypothetical protein
MVRTRGLKTEYTPIKKLENGSYIICWDYKEEKEPVYAELTEEESAAIESGEHVERTIIGEKDTDYCTYMIENIHNTKNINYIKRIILGYYNTTVDNKILSGFTWNNMPVWLSQENQFNYKAAFDLAVVTNSASLPVIFKFGTTENPVYHEFTTLEELQEFYMSAIAHINTCLTEGWQQKDAIDWSVYEAGLVD